MNNDISEHLGLNQSTVYHEVKEEKNRNNKFSHNIFNLRISQSKKLSCTPSLTTNLNINKNSKNNMILSRYSSPECRLQLLRLIKDKRKKEVKLPILNIFQNFRETIVSKPIIFLSQLKRRKFENGNKNQFQSKIDIFDRIIDDYNYFPFSFSLKKNNPPSLSNHNLDEYCNKRIEKKNSQFSSMSELINSNTSNCSKIKKKGITNLIIRGHAEKFSKKFDKSYIFKKRIFK